jgi:RNA polymerase sigma-70 factor (ECF subfamily)
MREPRWTAYEQHHGAIRGFVARRVERDAVDDVVAEVFAVAWRRLPDDEAGQLPWLYAVAGRVVHHHYRARARRARLLARVAAHADRAQAPDPADKVVGDPLLARAFALLSERDRETLRLVAWEGLSVDDAARAAGCSAATFAVRCSRARARLADALERVGAEPGGLPATRRSTHPIPSDPAPEATT